MALSIVLAEFRYDTNNGGEVLYCGQFDPAYLSFDDGVSTTTDLVDNTNPNSRVGFWYRTDLDTPGTGTPAEAMASERSATG